MNTELHTTPATETHPLTGKTIIVTRPAGQSGGFSTTLASLGASVVAFPTIRISDPESWDDLDRCVSALGTYHGIVFSSANAVERFFTRTGPEALGDAAVYAIGSKTQEALRAFHVAVTIIPERFTSEDLLAAVVGAGVDGKRILYARGSMDRGVLGEGLAKAGAEVDECIVYRTELADPGTTGVVREKLSAHAVDAATFFSPSSVEGFFESLLKVSPDVGALHRDLEPVMMAAIGSVTAGALHRRGYTAAVVPPVSTSDALVGAIVDHYTS